MNALQSYEKDAESRYQQALKKFKTIKEICAMTESISSSKDFSQTEVSFEMYKLGIKLHQRIESQIGMSLSDLADSLDSIQLEEHPNKFNNKTERYLDMLSSQVFEAFENTEER